MNKPPEIAETVAKQLAGVKKLKDRFGRFWANLLWRTWVPGYARNPFYDELRRDFFEKCLSRGGLEPGHRVIDIGCGIGGVAEHLLAFLSLDGRYDGLDIDARAIKVCERDFEPLHPGFRFKLMDVRSSMYRPYGKTPVSEYRFPFDDETFDLAILRSVFTHMMPGDVEHYLSEVRRLLRPGGRSMITFLLLADDADIEPDDERQRLEKKVPHQRDGYRIADPDLPETRVAYSIEWVRGLYARTGLRVIEPIEFRSRRAGTGQRRIRFPDLVVAERV